MHHINRYTQRQLSHDSDILEAFTGVLNDERISNYKGLPVLAYRHCDFQKPPPRSELEGFFSGLCWDSERPSERQQGFPSWSWTGWKGAVGEYRCKLFDGFDRE